MECQVCNIRSAVGACEESQMLICEECSVPCYKCGKRIANTKGHVTKSGHIYCTPCFKERAARRSGRDVSREEAKPARGGLIPEGDAKEAEVVEEEAVLSKFRGVEPWKLSLYGGAASLLMMLFFVFFPSYRGVRTPGEGYFPIFVLLALIPAVAGLGWAAAAFLSKQSEFDPSRNRALIGVALAIGAFVTSAFAMQAPPLPPELQMLRGDGDQTRTDQERQERRQRFLGGNRADRQTPPQ